MDLLEDGVLEPGEPVVFNRPRLGRRYEAVINADGTFTIEDNTTWNSPSLAAINAAGVVSYDGWEAWRVPRLDNQHSMAFGSTTSGGKRLSDGRH